MDAIAIVAALVAVASLALLVVIERRLSALTADRARGGAAPASRAVSPEQASERRLQVFERRLDNVLSALERIEARLGESPVAPAAPASLSPTTVEEVRPVPEPTPVPATSPPTFAVSELHAVPAPILPELDGPVSAGTSDPMPAIDSDALITEYRALIAQPRRADISRWIDQHGGRSCEVVEGDVLQVVDQDAGAPLALLPLSDELALVVPSGRTVVDFPTSYVDGMTLRLKTRGSFALEADGATAMRLVAPAVARLADGRWRIERPGRLAGFASA